MTYLFAPGCALLMTKPQLAGKLHALLRDRLGEVGLLDACCHNRPDLPAGTRVVNVCPGCDRRYRENYTASDTVSLWELLASWEEIPLPDYGGTAMAVLDACPTRGRGAVHEAVRALLRRMNIRVVEPERTRESATCCGDSFYGALPVEDVKAQMARRAAEMPAEEVAVYCVSCVKSMFLGGKRPRHLVDLLLGEETVPGTLEPDAWHAELDAFIAAH